MFGGAVSSQTLNDTWEWDGTTWVQRTLAASPGGRTQHAMAYDAARSRVVLFGGYQVAADVWESDGTNWTSHAVGSGPQAVAAPSIAYYPSRVVLFGGTPAFSTSLSSETWEWDGVSWSQRLTASAPPGRRLAAMAYDAVRGRVVLFGGVGPNGARRGDTWEYGP